MSAEDQVNGRGEAKRFWSGDLQSERFLVETIMVFDFVQSLLLEGSFDPVEHIVDVMLLWSRTKDGPCVRRW